jgi:D-alanyl-D-alanine carboxypeptidase-like protein
MKRKIVVCLVAASLCGFGGLVMSALLMVGVASSSSTAEASTCGPATETSTGSGGDLDGAQWANAKAIIDTGLSLHVPQKGLVVAIATAMQESTLRNLPGGDRDSVGLFQQRAAWGTFAQRTDPAQSATMFFKGGHGGQRGLLQVPGWEDMAVTVAAQAVQVSAFPTAYAKWETLARTVVSTVAQDAPVEPCQPQEDPAGGRCQVVNVKQYGNGQLPAAALCALSFAKGHRLRGDAANSIERLNRAYKAQFGRDLCVTDSYRSLAEQYDVYRRKPGLAAKPGTSNHGWGLALDLCGGLQTAGTPQDAWMHAHEQEFGWTHPRWAEPSGSKPEAWHHECAGCGAK